MPLVLVAGDPAVRYSTLIPETQAGNKRLLQTAESITYQAIILHQHIAISPQLPTCTHKATVTMLPLTNTIKKATPTKPYLPSCAAKAPQTKLHS